MSVLIESNPLERLKPNSLVRYTRICVSVVVSDLLMTTLHFISPYHSQTDCVLPLAPELQRVTQRVFPLGLGTSTTSSRLRGEGRRPRCYRKKATLPLHHVYHVHLPFLIYRGFAPTGTTCFANGASAPWPLAAFRRRLR